MSDKSTTPRPWMFTNEDMCAEIKGANFESITGDLTYYPWAPSIEDMKLIVRAVNQYDHVAELVRACQEALLQIEYIEEKFGAGTSTGEATKVRLRSALAKF